MLTLDFMQFIFATFAIMEKFRNKYRIASARASWWNYGWNGANFITICTDSRQSFFSEIQGGNMKLSHQGILADVLWHQIPFHASHIELGAFVVIPNHIHGILILNDLENNDGPVSNVTGVETGHALSLHALSLQLPTKTHAQSRFQNQGKNTISSIVGSYKSAVTKNANRLGLEFGWQERFFDNIIRSDADYQRIND